MTGDVVDLIGVERRVRSASRRLPQVKTSWSDGDVTYEGGVVSFGGSLYQARKDTGLRPGDPAVWVCIARAGKDGVDGKSIRLRGAFDATKGYRAL